MLVGHWLTGNYENRCTYLTQEVFVSAKWNGSHPAPICYNSLCVIKYINLCLCIQYNNLLTPSLSLKPPHPSIALDRRQPLGVLPASHVNSLHADILFGAIRKAGPFPACPGASRRASACHQTLHPAGGEREIRALSASHKTCQERINQITVH